MVIKNTPANRTLVRELSHKVNQYAGFNAIVDKQWNCGEDIRFEIGTVYSLDCPFIISNWLDGDGRFEIKVRMLRTEYDLKAADELMYWLNDLNHIVSQIKETVEVEKNTIERSASEA